MANGRRYNLINSAILELFDFIRLVSKRNGVGREGRKQGEEEMGEEGRGKGEGRGEREKGEEVGKWGGRDRGKEE